MAQSILTSYFERTSRTANERPFRISPRKMTADVASAHHLHAMRNGECHFSKELVFEESAGVLSSHLSPLIPKCKHTLDCVKCQVKTVVHSVLLVALREFFMCGVGAGAEKCGTFYWVDEWEHAHPQCVLYCNHREPAVVRIASKVGPNQGRQYYMCGRTRKKQCNFFLWASPSSAPATPSKRPRENNKVVTLVPGNSKVAAALPTTPTITTSRTMQRPLRRLDFTTSGVSPKCLSGNPKRRRILSALALGREALCTEFEPTPARITSTFSNGIERLDSPISTRDNRASFEGEGVPNQVLIVGDDHVPCEELESALTTTEPKVRLDCSFYCKDVVSLAKALIGKRLVRVIRGERIVGRIVETEAYLGSEDKATNRYGAKATAANRGIYAAPGTAIVYTVYVKNRCFHISADGEGAMVLIRALDPQEGLPLMREHRRASRKSASLLRETDLCSGPGKVGQALNIDLWMDGLNLSTSNTIWLEGGNVDPFNVVASPRVNVDYAMEWAALPLRFSYRFNAHVSRKPKTLVPSNEVTLASIQCSISSSSRDGIIVGPPSLPS